MKIKRTTATKIMSIALHHRESCLVAILQTADSHHSEKLMLAQTIEELNQLIQDYPDSILVFNQNQQSIHLKDQLVSVDGQQHIEIFQDTVGVFGLRAFLQKGKIETPVILEFEDVNH